MQHSLRVPSSAPQRMQILSTRMSVHLHNDAACPVQAFTCLPPQCVDIAPFLCCTLICAGCSIWSRTWYGSAARNPLVVGSNDCRP